MMAGILLGWAFFTWQNRRVAQRKTPLLSPEVLDSPTERTTVAAMLFKLLAATGLGFVLPLYMQIIQGYDGIGTVLNLIPNALAIVVASIFVNRLVGPLTVRQISRASFLLMAAGLVLIGVAIQNTWDNVGVIIGLIAVGLGSGAVTTVLSNVLVTSSPPELAGEVGGLRGTVNNLGGAIGAAVAGALLITLLAVSLSSAIVSSTVLRDEVKNKIDLSHPAFISNAQLEAAFSQTAATEAEVAEAVRINSEARLEALRITLFVLAAFAVLGLIPSGGLPNQVQQPAAVAKPATITASPGGKKAGVPRRR